MTAAHEIRNLIEHWSAAAPKAALPDAGQSNAGLSEGRQRR